MFFRVKTVGSNSYVQVVESYRDEGRPRQRVLLTLGSLEELPDFSRFRRIPQHSRR